MMFEDRFFVHKNLNRQKLVDYGFALQEDGFAYVVPVMQGEFDLHIHIGLNGDVQSKMVERDTGEEYVLYRTESATGSFVGEARRECANVLDDIAKKCYDKCNFQTRQSGELIAYVRARYGDELEFLWDKFPYDAVWRRRDTKKWYAIIMTVSATKLGLEREGEVEVIDLRLPREDMQALVDNVRYFPGYHMNKSSWYTIVLDTTVSTQELCERIDLSYTLATK